MAFVPKNNTGALFKNDDKTEETHPNAKGSALIEGVDFWVAAWTKTDKNGNKFQSLSFKPKDAPKPKNEPFADMPDDIPF